MAERKSYRNAKEDNKASLADLFPVEKQESSALKKLNMSKTLIKKLEDDFDDFEMFLNSDKKPDTEHKIDTKLLDSLNSMDKLDMKFKKNKQDYKEILDDYENLDFFVDDKEEEERHDQVRSLQEYNSFVHDTFGYNIYFNKLFLKIDEEKLEFMLNEHKIVNLVDRRIESFLYAENGKKKKNWIYDAYTNEDLLMSFEQRKAMYSKFDLWLKNLHDFYNKNGSADSMDYEPNSKRQKRNLYSSFNDNKKYPIHNEINLNVLLLLQVLFMLSNDFFHNNMKYQYAFNPVFDLNNYLAYIKNKIPAIYDRLSTITLKELNTFKFFKVFLDKEFVNDYHIGIFMKLKLLPQNIVDVFREAYYGNDFEKFIRNNTILDANDIAKDEQKLINLQDADLDEMKENEMLKNSLINLKSCMKIEELHLLSIKRAIKIQNYFINRKRSDDVYKQMAFLQSIVTGKKVKYYKHLATEILKELHDMKTQQSIDAENKIDKKKLKSSDGAEYSDDDHMDDAQATVNNYGFSKDSLPDLYIKRLLETKLITCDKPAL